MNALLSKNDLALGASFVWRVHGKEVTAEFQIAIEPLRWLSFLAHRVCSKTSAKSPLPSSEWLLSQVLT